MRRSAFGGQLREQRQGEVSSRRAESWRGSGVPDRSTPVELLHSVHLSPPGDLGIGASEAPDVILFN